MSGRSARDERYNASAKGEARRQRYEDSPRGQAVRHVYEMYDRRVVNIRRMRGALVARLPEMKAEQHDLEQELGIKFSDILDNIDTRERPDPRKGPNHIRNAWLVKHYRLAYSAQDARIAAGKREALLNDSYGLQPLRFSGFFRW